MRFKKKLAALGVAAALCGSFAVPAAAGVILSFNNVTANSVADVATGEAQLSVEISDAGANQVSFTFRNAGPNASSITDVYFDDGTLLGIASITDGSGVDFEQHANPGNLPGGNPIGFSTTAGFSADSEPPRQPNGVNPGEYVTILFNLINGQTYADTVAALDLDPNVTGSLRIGIHVQGFAGGGSESFVNNPPGGGGPPTGMPEPGTLLLLGAGLAGLGFRRWRFAVA